LEAKIMSHAGIRGQEAPRLAVTAALQTEGFGVLTTIDVQATMRARLDVAVEGYIILGACQPSLARRALTIVPKVGLLLPCNVVARQVESGGEVGFVDPLVMPAWSPNQSLCLSPKPHASGWCVSRRR
jgi:hypothetical protein